MSVNLQDIVALLPVWILLATGLVILMLEVYAVGSDRGWAAGLAVVGSIVALYFALRGISAPPVRAFKTAAGVAAIVADPFGHLASSVVIAAGAVASLISPGYLKNAKTASGEYYALILFAVIGMIVMVMAGDLITLFLGLETMSIAVYVLTGTRPKDARSTEAALKYFLMGAFATGFLLFGIAFIYGATRSVGLEAIASFARLPIAEQPLLAFGLALLFVGFAFKVAAVPFHLWAPDVYEGAPTPITGFMAVGVKAAAFIGLLRIVLVALAPGGKAAPEEWIDLFRVLAVLTILGGNAMAVVQKNVKRMLAYSSIAHAGYALIGLVAAAKGDKDAGAAVLFYLLAYTFMTLGAFGVLTFLERKEGGPEAERFGAFAGMGFKHPALGLAMSLFMIALAGMPPTGGFFGKLYVFSAALNAGELPLVLVGVLGSVISVYYYLRVIVAFYMRDVPDPGPLPTATRTTGIALGIAAAVMMVLHLGVFPTGWIEFGKQAIRSLRLG